LKAVDALSHHRKKHTREERAASDDELEEGRNQLHVPGAAVTLSSVSNTPDPLRAR
jgi:hypothetical protein